MFWGVFSPEIWFSLLCSNCFKCYLPLSVLSQTVQFLISNFLKWMMIKGPPHPVTFYKHMLKLGELIVLWNYSLVCKWNCLSRFVAKWVGLQTTALLDLGFNWVWDFWYECQWIFEKYVFNKKLLFLLSMVHMQGCHIFK